MPSTALVASHTTVDSRNSSCQHVCLDHLVTRGGTVCEVRHDFLSTSRLKRLMDTDHFADGSSPETAVHLAT